MSALDGRVVVVTGAAKRIGRAIALRAAREGARVAVHFHGSEKEAHATAVECGDAQVFQADLEKVAEIERLFENVQRHFGRIDGLVNSAGRFASIDPLKITESDWEFIHSVNLKATFFCAQQAARRMLEGDGGRIARRATALGAACALQRLESRRDHVDARAGEGVGPEGLR
jgi:3-oxoacyl-[acyl-carrier protein] reductase/pteridine reductase